jgi:glycosyltransferase involved in cell wall biosynthesis
MARPSSRQLHNNSRTLHDNVEVPRTPTDAGRRATAPEAGASRQESGALRLLFAVPFSPRAQAMHGGRVIGQLLHRLAERHRVAVVYFRRAGSPTIDSELAARCDLVHEIPLEDQSSAASRWRHRLHVLAAPLTAVPSPVAFLHRRELARACVELAGRWKPDVVQIEHEDLAYCGPALRESGTEAVLVVTSHQPGVPASEDQARVTAGRQRLAHRLDAATWKRYWSRTLPAFDAIVTLTAHDRELFAAEGIVPRVVAITPGIELPDQPLSPTGDEEPSVLFLGGYWHPPNADAAVRLVRSIMPAVRRRLPNLPLLLVGADPTRDLREAAGADDEITGAVPSVTPFLDRASVLVLPIRIGGGVRVKLLEALAAGKVVVASPLAASGLALRDREEIVFADTDEEFADAIVSLIQDEASRSRIGGAARRWALRHLSWDDRVRDYERLYRSLIVSRTS